jgi:hypothetical protein
MMTELKRFGTKLSDLIAGSMGDRSHSYLDDSEIQN